ncbi:hypothetical protein [uncultured Desulfuromonas sp.]|uniref:hypothetical protein n=1 Tax=uncultured Desulfuromonas sp. TaxID=181013 RepID=UPI002AAA6B66|nr:hypothetical protein [uncultured Desulfuromonas sp.]
MSSATITDQNKNNDKVSSFSIFERILLSIGVATILYKLFPIITYFYQLANYLKKLFSSYKSLPLFSYDSQVGFLIILLLSLLLVSKTGGFYLNKEKRYKKVELLAASCLVVFYRFIFPAISHFYPKIHILLDINSLPYIFVFIRLPLFLSLYAIVNFLIGLNKQGAPNT